MVATTFWLATLLLVFNLVRPFAFPISIPDGLYMLAFLALIWEGVARKRPRGEWLPFHPLWLPSYLILVGGLMASMNAVSPGSSIRVTLTAFYVFTFWTSMTVVMVRRGHIERMITALILGTVFTSAVAIFDFLSGTQIGQIFTNSGQVEAVRVFYYRASGTMGHPNELSMLIAVVGPVVLSRVLDSGNVSVRIRLANALVFSILVLALLFTGSATGVVGIGVACTIVLLVRARSSQLITHPLFLVRAVLFSLAALVLLMVFVSPLAARLGITDRLARQDMLYRITELSVPNRYRLMQEALNHIIANPLLGEGMDQTATGGLTSSQIVTTIYVHNTLVEAWLAGGLVVVLGLLALYWQVLSLAARGIVASLRDSSVPCLLGLSASSIGWIVMDMGQPAIYQRYKWLVAGLVIGLSQIMTWKRDSILSSSLQGARQRELLLSRNTDENPRPVLHNCE